MRKIIDKKFTEKLYKKFDELDKKETLILWLFGSNGAISGVHSEPELSKKYVQAKELSYIKEKNFNLRNLEVRKILDKTFKKHGKSLLMAEKVWLRNYRLEKNSFLELLHRFLENTSDVNKIMKLTGIEQETLFRLIRVLLENEVITVNKNGDIIVKKHLAREKTARFLDRPAFKRTSPDVQYDQYYCTWETNLKRVKKITEDLLLEGKKVLFVGDDDLTSVILASLSNAEIHVFDIDEKVLSAIKEFSNKNKLNIKLHKGDLRDDLPRSLCNYFDIFLCDPTYTLVGVNTFIYRGWQSLKKVEGVKGYISFCPYFMGKKAYYVEKFILDLGFRLEEIIPSFNEYPDSQEHIADFFANKLSNDFKIKVDKIRYNSFLHSDLFVVKLTYPDKGKKVKPPKGELYDYISLD